MAKKKLSKEETIAKYKRKRRVGILLRILIPLIVIILVLQASYYAFYYVVFTANRYI